MKWLVIVLCALLAAPCLASNQEREDECNWAPEAPEDRRTDKTKLNIMHWNTEWLFLDKWDKRWSSYEEAVEHLHDVAKVIRQVSADVINLAEVESCAVLQALVDAIGDDTYEFYLKRGTDTSTGQNVGLLTRVDPIEDLWRTSDRAAYPVEGSHCSQNQPSGHKRLRSSTYGVSKHYFTRIAPEGFGEIFLAGTHLLAFPDDPARCEKREAQSMVLQSILRDEMMRGNSTVVAFGDMNDFDGQVPDVANSQPISRTLEILKDVVQLSGWDGDELLNVAERVEQDRRYTAYYNPDKSVCKTAKDSSTSIDHVLVDSRLLARTNVVHFDNAVFQPPCATQQGVFSDHWPILVQLEVNSTSTEA